MYNDPAWAEAWDTALLGVSEKDAERMAEENSIQALFIYDEDQKLKEYMSTAFLTTQ